MALIAEHMSKFEALHRKWWVSLEEFKTTYKTKTKLDEFSAVQSKSML